MIPKPGSITKLESAAIAGVLLLLSVALLRPSIRGHDGPGHYVYLQSILLDGDLDFSNDYAAFDRLHRQSGEFGFQLAAAPVSPATGKPANRYGIGAALFWAPFVIPVHLVLTRLAPDLADGISQPYQTAVGVASAWWGCLALWILLIRLREDFSLRTSLLALFGFLLATPLSFYLWAHGSMSHAISFFVATCALLSLEGFIRSRRLSQAVLFGAWTGLILVVRTQDATWTLLLFSFFVGQTLCRNPTSGPQLPDSRRWLAIALAVLGILLALLPQIAVWRILYGGWLSGPAPYLNREGGGFSPLPIHLFSALFSGRHGALSWHPMLIVGLVGLGMIALKKNPPDHSPNRWLALLGLAGFIVQAWLVGCWSMWWAGASFGNRFFISSYPFLILGLAHAMNRFDRRAPRWLLPVVALALMAWNVGLLVQYGTEMIPREKPVPMMEIIGNQFTKVPAWMIKRITGSQ